jgi:hypothetical protein
MIATFKTLTVTLLGLCLVGLLSSCSQGPAEKVGQSIDHAVQDTKDAAKDAKNDVTK